MTIHYTTKEDFYNGIYEIIRLGLTFRADYDSLIIHLTGGY